MAMMSLTESNPESNELNHEVMMQRIMIMSIQRKFSFEEILSPRETSM